MPDSTFRNEFAWSVTRDGVFIECPRRYYFQYYGYWGGWEPDAEKRVRETYVLKQLKNKYTWVGEVVHDCIQRTLNNLQRRIPVLPVEQILEITRDRMRSDFRDSRAGRYRYNPKQACGLFEHEYNMEVSDDEWREAAEQVDRCLLNFYNSDTYRQLSTMNPDDILEVEKMSKFDLDGNEVTIRLDCATRETDKVVVWDWKTGRRESSGQTLQMACYAFYAAQRFGVPIHRVVTRRFELLHDTIHEETIGEKALGELVTYLRGSIADMKALLDDPERNIANEDRFAKISQQSICYRCNFLRVCKPSQVPGNRRDETRPE